jgi:uncharacterized protein
MLAPVVAFAHLKSLMSGRTDVHNAAKAIIFANMLMMGAAAAAQTAGPADRRYVPAPWWMREPVIASQGQVHVELPANRAEFSAQFSEVGRSAEAAGEEATRRSAPLDARLQAFGPTRVQFTRTFSTRPLYRQYRDGDGNRVDNQRADQIENYEVVSRVSIQVIDVTLIEEVYNAVAAASPSSIAPVQWSLRANDATISALAVAAMRDATRRARAGAEAAGTQLGPVRIIDPSGSVCQTQVLTGWPGYTGDEQSRDVSDDSDIVVSARASPAPPPPPPPPPPSTAFTLRPPLLQLSDRACVIFALQ